MLCANQIPKQTNNNIPTQAPNQKMEDALVDKGLGLLFSGNFEQAIKQFEKALQKNAKNTDALDGLGEAYFELGKHKEALSTFEKSCKIAPDEGMGTKWMFLGQLRVGVDALLAYRKGLEVLENNYKLNNAEELKFQISNGYVSISELYLSDLCMEETAERDCEQAIETALLWNPNNLEALQTKASIRLSQVRVEEAKELLDQIRSSLKSLEDSEEDFAPSFDLRVNCAKLFVEVEDHGSAIEILERLIMEDDEITQVWMLLGLCHAKTNSLDNASECYERAGELLKNFLSAEPSDEFFLAQAKQLQELMNDLDNSMDVEENNKNDTNNEAMEEEEEAVVATIQAAQKPKTKKKKHIQ